MPINLDDIAVRIFRNIIDKNHDNIITPDEAAQGINNLLLVPISRAFPGIETDSVLNPINLHAFLSEDGTIGEPELKALLEQYFEFLANKTNNPTQNIIAFENEFNKYRLQQQQQVNELPEHEMNVVEDEDSDQLRQAIALSLDTGVVALPRTQKTLNEINEIIQVFNPLLPGNESASIFLDEQADYNPFIIRSQNGQFSGDAIDWPASSSSGKEFIECKDDTPASWRGNSYGRWIKTNAREFIKINILGSPTLIIKPNWYDTRIVPGIKYFNMVSAGNVFKFMSKVLASQNLPADFSALGADHCNQTGPVGVYVLQEITLDELNSMVPAGGKKNRKNKSKNLRKFKNKYNKLTKKSIRKNKISRKTSKKNKKRKTKKLN